MTTYDRGLPAPDGDAVLLPRFHVATRESQLRAYAAEVAVNRRRRARAAHRRKRRMERVEHDLSPDQWAALEAAWGGCAYCGDMRSALQRDCVLAISRGGRYTLANVVPACRSCNTSKCNEEVTTWMRRKRLDESSFLLRHLEICALLASSPRNDGAPPPFAD